MKKPLTAVLALTIGLALAGCAGTPQEPAGDTSKPAASPTETTAPLVAETPTPDASSPEAQFLTLVRAGMQPDTIIPDATDEQLLEAGNSACEQMRAGTPATEIRLIDGEQPNGLGTYVDSQNIASSAHTAMCPDGLLG